MDRIRFTSFSGASTSSVVKSTIETSNPFLVELANDPAAVANLVAS
jgi:hypothetical protein